MNFHRAYLSSPFYLMRPHIGFPQNSVLQLAEFRESSAESLQTICGNIARYPWNLRMYLRNDPLKGCHGTFEGDCTAVYGRFTQSPVDCGWLSLQRTTLRAPEDDFMDSITCDLPKIVCTTHTRQIRGRPKDNSADSWRWFRGSRKVIPWIPKGDSVDPERWFRRLATDDPRISAQIFMENCDELLWKSTDFRKLLVTCTICENFCHSQYLNLSAQ